MLQRQALHETQSRNRCPSRVSTAASTFTLLQGAAQKINIAMGSAVSTCVIVRLDGSAPDAVGVVPAAALCLNDVPRPDADAALFADVLGLTPANDARLMLQLVSRPDDLIQDDPVWISIPANVTYGEFTAFLNAATGDGVNTACWSYPNTNTVLTFYDFGGVSVRATSVKRSALVTSAASVVAIALAAGLATMIAKLGAGGSDATEFVEASSRSTSAADRMSMAVSLVSLVAIIAASALSAAAAVDAVMPRVPASVPMSTAATAEWNKIVRGPRGTARRSLAHDAAVSLRTVLAHGNPARRAEQRAALSAPDTPSHKRTLPRGRRAHLRPHTAELLAFAHAFARGEVPYAAASSSASSVSTAYGAPTTDAGDTVRSVTVYADARFVVELGWIGAHTRVPTHTHESDVAVIPLSPNMTLTLLDPERVIEDATVGQPYLVEAEVRHSAAAGAEGGHFFAVFAPSQAHAKSLTRDF